MSATDLPKLPALGGNPLVSVMIVNYNYERFLPEAIDSVLAQTYQHFEIIICDDGSKDNSRGVIEEYARRDARIKPIFQENGGVGAALNAAYAGTSGPIISMLDADDLFTPEKLARVVEKFAPGGRVGTVLNAVTKIGPTGEVVGRIPQFGALDRGELRERLLRSAAHWSVAPTSGISFRRECAEHIFPIPDKKFRTEVDGYMCTIAPLFYAVDAIDESVTMYRIHSSNVTAPTTIDVKFCEKIMNAGERVFSVLEETAQKHGWSVTKLEHNPTYCEMRLIRDYLQGADRRQLSEDRQRLKEAAARVETADRGKTKAKANVLALATVLPLSLGKRMIDMVYLPGGLKNVASRAARGGRPLRE
jgi:glycosyltransferase involved in cell wall biosynthesis